VSFFVIYFLLLRRVHQKITTVVRKIYNYYFSKHKAFVRELTPILGFIPTYLPFYIQAFIHRNGDDKNAAKNAGKYEINNERLEFLGDAILDTMAAEFLFKKYPTQDEGFLTQMRSKLVNRKILNRIAEEMNFDMFLRQFGASSISTMMLGNALEAFIGSIYLDVGYNKTKAFISRMFRKHVNVQELELLNDNYKSVLLEYCQRQQKKLEYEVVKQFRNRNHRDRFQVSVTIGGEVVAIGEEFTKKSAEQVAAQKALIKLGVVPADTPIVSSE
jgi:ribonuclease-3